MKVSTSLPSFFKTNLYIQIKLTKKIFKNAKKCKEILEKKRKTQKTWVRRCSLSSRFLHWRMGTI
jgi:hypothetical protein